VRALVAANVMLFDKLFWCCAAETETSTSIPVGTIAATSEAEAGIIGQDEASRWGHEASQWGPSADFVDDRREDEEARCEISLQQVGDDSLTVPSPVIPAKVATTSEDTSAADADREAKEKKCAEAKAKEEEETKRKERMLKDAGGAFERMEWGKAVELYSKFLKEFPKDASALAGRGGAYVRSGKFKEALPDLDEALRIDESNMFAMRDRAEARFKTGDYDGAIEDFNKKLSLAGGDGRALCGRGECRLKKGDKEGACTDFEFAKRLGYKSADELLKKAKAG